MWMMKDDQKSVDSDIIALKLKESLGNNKIEKEIKNLVPKIWLDEWDSLVT